MIDVGNEIPIGRTGQGDGDIGILACEYAGGLLYLCFHIPCYYRAKRERTSLQRVRTITRREAEEHEYRCAHGACQKFLYEPVW